MKTIVGSIKRRWKQIMGVGAVYLALEASAVVFVALWGMTKLVA